VVMMLADEKAKLPQVSEAVVFYDVEEPKVAVKEEKERVYLQAMKVADVYPTTTDLDASLVLEQFDNGEVSLATEYFKETFCRNFPGRVPWTPEKKKFLLMRGRYVKKLRAYAYVLLSFEKREMEGLIRAMCQESDSLDTLLEQYRYNDLLIKKLFYTYASHRFEDLVLSMRSVKEKPRRASVVSASQVGVVISLISTTRTFCLSESLWEDLRSRYVGKSHQDFVRSVYFVIMNYYSFIKHGSSFFSSVPRIVYQEMWTHYGYTNEMFASPLNVILPNYCSAERIDLDFGSMGDAFDIKVLRGKWIANPPFLDEFIEKMIHLFERIMTEESFELILILPVPYSSRSRGLQDKLMLLKYFYHRLTLPCEDALYDQYVKKFNRIGFRHRHFLKCDTIMLFFSNVRDPLDLNKTLLFAENWKKISAHKEEVEIDSFLE